MKNSREGPHLSYDPVDIQTRLDEAEFLFKKWEDRIIQEFELMDVYDRGSLLFTLAETARIRMALKEKIIKERENKPKKEKSKEEKKANKKRGKRNAKILRILWIDNRRMNALRKKHGEIRNDIQVRLSFTMEIIQSLSISFNSIAIDNEAEKKYWMSLSNLFDKTYERWSKKRSGTTKAEKIEEKEEHGVTQRRKTKTLQTV